MSYSYKRRWYAEDFAIPLIIAAVVALFVGWIVLAPALASESRARNAVENLGWSNVHVESKKIAFGSWSGCSDHDDVQFTVSGTVNGQRRTAHVCATIPFGGYTVRN